VRRHDTRSPQRRLSLAKEITIVLVVKALALCVIWLAFFSSPSGRNLDAGGVARSLLQPPPQATQPQETERAARSGTR